MDFIFKIVSSIKYCKERYSLNILFFKFPIDELKNLQFIYDKNVQVRVLTNTQNVDSKFRSNSISFIQTCMDIFSLKIFTLKERFRRIINIMKYKIANNREKNFARL